MDLIMTAIGAEARPGMPATRSPSSSETPTRRVPLRPGETRIGPAPAFAWLLGTLAVLACAAPWLAHGRLWLGAIFAVSGLLAGYDAWALWRMRNDLSPVLLQPESGLRGHEGQVIRIPLAFAGSKRSHSAGNILVALMPATRESENAVQAIDGAQRLSLAQPSASPAGAGPTVAGATRLWPWSPEIKLLQRGLWPMPRIGVERSSRFGIWRLRRWFDCSEPLRIDADIKRGRRELLRSPIYRAMVASRETPWSGRGRDFERLREYQPGDNFSEIAWKSTARRGAPVTRLFQWEQKQEIYFIVDQSRASAQLLSPDSQPPDGGVQQTRAPRRLLDLAVETALVGASAAVDLGDEFGLISYAEKPKKWLPAGNGQHHFHNFRDQLLDLEPLPTTADYEALFSSIRLRLRRRAYLVLLADLAERSITDSLCRGVALLRSSHVVFLASIHPIHAVPAFSSGPPPRNDQDVYAALAGEKENQRLGALTRRLRQLGAELRFVSAESFLRTAVEGYLESKREQRL
jgi:uncharacterized protein (DUF58 family)